jgi:hypothetical protein
MDAKLIEKLDRHRYKYLLWQAVGFALLFPGVFLNKWLASVAPSHAVRIVFAVVALTGAGLWLTGLLSVRSNERRINRDPDLKAALNNEMIRLYGYKSLMWAFFATLILTVVILLLSEWWFTEMGANFACLILIYTAVMTLKIAQLVYLRR